MVKKKLGKYIPITALVHPQTKRRLKALAALKEKGLLEYAGEVLEQHVEGSGLFEDDIATTGGEG